MLSEIARRWAEVDHEAALTLLDTQKADPLYDELLLSVVSGYGKASPREAIALAIDRGMTKDLLRLGHLFKAYASTAPEEAVKAGQALNADSLVEETMRVWASSEPEAFLHFLDEREEGIKDSARRRAYEEIGKGLVESDPKAAADWVSTLTEENLFSDDLRSVLRATAGALTEMHPELALALLESPDLIANDYRYVFANYGANNWDGAMASLQDLEGAQKKHAVRGLLANLDGRSKDEILTHLPTLLDMLGSEGSRSYDILQKLDGETMLASVEQ